MNKDKLKLNIVDETAALQDLCVCRGTSVPDYEGYVNPHPEFTKYPTKPWNKSLLLEQQDGFFSLLDKYGVRLHFPETDPALPWQMYTRDTGFVVGNKLFFCAQRGLPEREGEIAALRLGLTGLADTDFVAINSGRIEGGDVIVDKGMAYVGVSGRTTMDAVTELRQHVEVLPLYLGENVMHLDTRMTILPREHLLIHSPTFTQDDLTLLRRHFKLIEVTDREAKTLGTNVFVINPETIVTDPGHARIADALRDAGFRVEPVAYSEPIALAGSFRCSTMPLTRA